LGRSDWYACFTLYLLIPHLALQEQR